MLARAHWVARGYADMARSQSWRLSECPYSGWQRDAWQEGAWRWMCEHRVANRIHPDRDRAFTILLDAVRTPRT